MGIRVECPHGHVFKVKDKYAGKRGLCPHCDGQVVVDVPDALHSKDVQAAYDRAWQEGRESNSDSSIFDDAVKDNDPSASGSLLGSSVIRHNRKCPFCKESVPTWYAKCPKCGHFLDN